MIHFRNIRLKTSIVAGCLLTLSFFTNAVDAQVIWGSATGNAWLNASNWVGGSIPGAGQIAEFDANPTGTAGVGIHMDTASGSVSTGAIYMSAARNTSLIIGNSSPSTPGTLSLSGATVTLSNVILANLSSSGGRLTIQNTQGGTGGSTLELNASGSSSVILTGTGTSTGLGNSIYINTIFSGSGAIRFLGNGTWDAATSTGNNGGLLRLTMPNTFTGGITIGNSDGTSSGILELTRNNAVNNVSGNDIIIHPNSQLYLTATSGSTYAATNTILSLEGYGNNATLTGKGALINASGSSYTWDGAISLAGDAMVSVVGSPTVSITADGNISGAGQLVKIGSGNLILNGTSNTWTGGTQINNGKITVNAGSAISNGILNIAQVTTNPVIVFNNTNQTISGLTSSFTTTNNTNTITLNGTRLTINQSFFSEYGGPSSLVNSVITGTGSVVKTGTGTLKLTSTGNSFSGGLTITAGKIKLNPSNNTTFTNSSPDTLNGGTLSTDSLNRVFTFNLGTLALTDNSTIELGNDTTHSLKFAASNTIAWVSGKTLLITHWMGSYNGTTGTKGKIYIGTTSGGLTSIQLAQIKFDDGAGHIYNATQLSTGEIVPAAPVITTPTAAYGPFCNNAATTISVPFSTVGPFIGTFSVQLSNASGVFPADFTTNIIGTGTTSPISASIAVGTALGTGYRLRVINPTPTPTFGSNNGSNITVTGAPAVAVINGQSAIVNGGTATYTDATSGGTWSSSNPSVLTISAAGIATALSIGTATVSYAVTNSCSITGYATKNVMVVTVPAITSISPLQGLPGTTVTITGTNFNSTYTNHIVYFGATKATVSAGSTTSLTVTVPANAAYSHITVIDTTSGLIAYAPAPFLPVYTNTGLIPNAVNFKPLVNYTTGANPIGVAVSDLDGDGKPDVVVSNSGPNTLYIYRNTSTTSTITTGTFASPISIATGAGPYYVKVADLDGDGKQDIIVANTSTSSNKVSVFRNTSTTGISFAARVDYATGGTAPTDISIADYDKDGKPDIAIVNQGSSRIGILKNVSSPGSITASSFATAVSYNTGLTPFKLFSGDLDGDGFTDIAVTNFSSNTVSLFHNNGTTGTITTASFATATTLSGSNAPTGITGGDIDGDGKTDLLLTNSGAATLSIYRNTNTTAGTLSFAGNVDYTTGVAPEDLATGDIDGDGKLDIAVGNYTSNTVSIFRNTATSGSIGAGSLSARTDFNVGSNPSGMVLSDIDGDGKPDIAIASGSSATISFLKNYPLPPIGAISGADSICNGTATTLSNSVAGGTWVSSNTAIATVSATGVVTSISPGVDTIIYYTVAQGDTNIVYHPLTVDANVTVGTIAGAGNVCIGALLPLSNPVPSGRWSSSDTTIASISTTGFVSGRAVGSVTITYTISNTCGTSIDTAVVTVNPSSGYTIGAISGASVICAGSSTLFTDTTVGGIWSSSDTAVAQISSAGVVTGVGHGTATISYGFTGSCGTYITTRPVTVDTLYNADSITAPNAICNGNSITVTNAAGSGGTWSVSNANATINATTGLLTAISAGRDTIAYTITNACGTVTGTKAITVNPQPYAANIIGPSSVCPTDTIFLTDTSVGGIWRLTNSKATISATGRVIGITAGLDTALYIVTNSCGSDTATAVITINPLPNPGIITGAATVCIGASITLRDTTSGGVWSSLNGNVSVADSVVTGVTAGSDTVRYTVTNSCGTASAIKKITVNAYPFVDTISGPSVVCTGSTITLTNSVAGGVWSKTNAKANINTAGVVTGITAGLDTIKYTVTANSCASVATKEITVLQLTAGSITSAGAVCIGSSIILKDTVRGGVWSNTSRFSTLTGSVLTGVSAGADTVKYTVTGSCGTVSVTKRIVVNPLPNAGTITGANLLAVGDTIILKDSITGGLWMVSSGNSLISAVGVLGGLKEGKDTVLYIVGNSCGKDTATFPVTIAASTKPGTITDIKLYPNPNRGNFDFTVVSKIDEVVTIVLSNSVFQAFDLFQVNTNTNGSIKLDYLANGVYFLSAITAQGWHTVKFVIAR